MFSMMRQRFSVAGLIATLALVFAMAGGALAAKKYVITSTKQISPSVLKKLKGKAGPAGQQGLQGSQGPQGPQGPAGANGQNGQDGEDGSPWTAGGVLPNGEDLTGMWGTSGGPSTAGDYSMVPISFALPLESVPTVNYLNAAGNLGIKITPTGELSPLTQEAFEENCPGTAAAPTADPGNLCVYSLKENATTAFNFTDATALEAPHTFGVVLPFKVNGEKGYAKGTWAVTAP